MTYKGCAGDYDALKLESTEILCIPSWEHCGIHSYSAVHTIGFSVEVEVEVIPTSTCYKSTFMNTTKDSFPVMKPICSKAIKP